MQIQAITINPTKIHATSAGRNSGTTTTDNKERFTNDKSNIMHNRCFKNQTEPHVPRSYDSGVVGNLSSPSFKCRKRQPRFFSDKTFSIDAMNSISSHSLAEFAIKGRATLGTILTAFARRWINPRSSALSRFRTATSFLS